MTDKYADLRAALVAMPNHNEWWLAGSKPGECDVMYPAIRETIDGTRRTAVCRVGNNNSGHRSWGHRDWRNADFIAAANPKVIATLLAERDDLREALDGLLNALPSATTHPAVKTARTALAGADDMGRNQ